MIDIARVLFYNKGRSESGRWHAPLLPHLLHKGAVFVAVTIRDVAALAGVSPSTVSRTCRNNPSISEETKERVRRAAKQLGYAMEGISTPATRTVGVILPPSAREVYENPFYLEMIRGINQFCNAHQYVSTIVTGRDNDEILSAVRLLVSSGAADAFILLYSRQGDTVIDYLVQANLLYVLIGKAYAYANKTVYIDNDNFLAGQEATEYLIRRGHRRIAYLGSDNAYLFTADRKRGYQSALALAGLPLREDYCVEMTALDMEDAALRALIERADRPTGHRRQRRSARRDAGTRVPDARAVHPRRYLDHFLQ